MKENLDAIFSPEAIAVIGASGKPGSVGNALMKNLVTGGFRGIIFPVNHKRASVQGIKCYAQVQDIPDPVDLAIIAIPAPAVPDVVAQCGRHGIKGVVIISAGFQEAGEGGRSLTEEMVSNARKYGMRILGPNCLGFLKPSFNLNASFAQQQALPGNIAFVSQSGALCTAILDWAYEQNVGFSHFVSAGSMVDVSFHDLIDYFGKDPDTSSILIYMESLKEARKFLSAARAFARNKPIIVLKAGKSSAGAEAANSHTGAMAGNDDAYDAAFKRAGIIRVNTIGELFDCTETLAMQPRPEANRLAILTNAGGPGVIATDYLMENGGALATLSEEIFNKLDDVLPAHWSRSNPVDILGDAGPVRYKQAAELLMKDEQIDGLLVILTPQAMTEPARVAEHLVSLQQHYNKPLLASWMGAGQVAEGRNILEEGNIPVYRIPETAVRSFLRIYSYSHNLKLLYETPSSIPWEFQPFRKTNRELLEKVMAEKRTVLSEAEAKAFLRNYEIPVPEGGLVRSEDEAASLASKTGFPLVMKIVSPDIWHKTDMGGVVLNVGSEEEARETYRDIMHSVETHHPDADVQGVMVEPMMHKQYELLIGSRKDPVFGPLIVFGMGGVAVEVFKDVNTGLPPLNMTMAQRLIEGTKIYQLLKGYRGMPGTDITAIKFVLYKFAYLLMDFPEISAIDINPFGVDEEGGCVLDAKIRLDEQATRQQLPRYAHMVISPYPEEYVTSFTMENRQEAVLRPVRPEDEPMEAEMFSRFSEETQRFRFFETIGEITHEQLVRYTHIDYDREIAIVAVVEEAGEKKMAGVARLIAGADHSDAEFAIVVADPWHGLGLGNKLMDYILEIASARGVEKVYATLLKENHIMLHMFRKRGFTVIEQMNGTFYAEKQLK